MGGCEDDCEPKDLSGSTPAYRRALMIVIVLNLSMGVGEMIGGVLATSQSLKADALDFLGDGAITLVGLLALRWSPVWRAKTAWLQGVSLALLGLGVLGNAVYRSFVRDLPDAGVMGVLGGIALVVNVVSAVLLVPHRHGDANARAVWLFSRNDALGNVAVIAAAGLVGWTGTSWPDLVVAVVIASLFLHSSWEILVNARKELRDRSASPALPWAGDVAHDREWAVPPSTSVVFVDGQLPRAYRTEGRHLKRLERRLP